jgi:hypothetical protein
VQLGGILITAAGAGRRGMSGAPCRGRAGSQGVDRETEILKNWKTGKLENWKTGIKIGDTDHQNFRISGFHPSTCRPKIWPGDSGSELGRGMS